MAGLKGYRVEGSGDPLAPFELIAPDGRTVAVCESRADAISFIDSDIGEQAYLGRGRAAEGVTEHARCDICGDVIRGDVSSTDCDGEVTHTACVGDWFRRSFGAEGL